MKLTSIVLIVKILIETLTIFKLAQMKTKNLKKISAINSVLIVEKYTDLECLKMNKFDFMESHDSNEILKKLDFQHQQSKSILIDNLRKFKISFKLVKVDRIAEILRPGIEELDNFKFQAVISLGGDGTFLQSSKLLEKKILIGINSQPSRSVGFLTPVLPDKIPEMVKQLSQGSFKIALRERLGAKINSKNLPFLAVNEIYFGVPFIYKTSYYSLEILQSKSKIWGSGLIVSTFTGSSAFYHSAGGAAFEPGNFGFVNLMPYKNQGEVATNMILPEKGRITVSAEKLHHELIFDSDNHRKILVNQGDKIEIFIDTNRPLKVFTF